MERGKKMKREKIIRRRTKPTQNAVHSLCRVVVSFLSFFFPLVKLPNEADVAAQ